MTIPSGSLDTEAFIYAVDDDIFEAIELISLVIDTTDYEVRTFIRFKYCTYR